MGNAGRPETDRFRMRALEEALRLVVDIVRRGGRVEAEHGAVKVRPESAAPAATIARLAEPLAEILSGQRKDWAKDANEIAIRVLPGRDGSPVAAVVRLFERRRIADAAEIVLAAPDATTRLLAFAADTTGILVSGTASRAEKAAIGSLIGEGRLGQHRLTATETPHNLGADYRDLLAGSSWIDMRVEAQDPLAQAFLLAMQVRSLRRQALREFKPGYYVSIAVGVALQAGQSVEDVMLRLHVSKEWVDRMNSGVRPAIAAAPAAPAMQPQAPTAASPIPAPNSSPQPAPSAADETPRDGQAASDRQVAFGRSILADLPFLAIDAGPDWEDSRDKATAFLNKAAPLAPSWRAWLAERKAALALRRALGAGATLAAAARLANVPSSDVKQILERPLQAEIAAAEKDLGAALGRSVSLKSTIDALLVAVATG